MFSQTKPGSSRSKSVENQIWPLSPQYDSAKEAMPEKNVNQNSCHQLFPNDLPLQSRISDDLNQTFEDMINMAV